MTEQQLPSQDPADTLNLGGALRATFAKLMQGVNTMLPARVVNYDRVQNVATVQPIIAVLTVSGEAVPRANLARVPVLALGGGGFVLNFPLKQGDLGWIEASDRDISIFMQSLNESQPATVRLHSFEDGRFIPDIFRQFDASAVEEGAMTLQTTDGAVRIELSPGKCKITAPTLEVEASTVNIRGVTTFENHVTMLAGAEIDGIEFTPHTHSGVTPGSGNSGPPNP